LRLNLPIFSIVRFQILDKKYLIGQIEKTEQKRNIGLWNFELYGRSISFVKKILERRR